MIVPLQKELETLLNRHSRENASDTPDFVLAHYMMRCLDAHEEAVRMRKAFGSVPVTQVRESSDSSKGE